MTPAIVNADTVIDEIEAGTLRPTTHAVIRVMHQHMRLEDRLQEDVLASFDRGLQPVDMAVFRSEMWAKIDALRPAEQSGLRLSNCLTRPDEAVDWHLAEYLVLWARQQGLSEQQIFDAFHAGANGN